MMNLNSFSIILSIMLCITVVQTMAGCTAATRESDKRLKLPDIPTGITDSDRCIEYTTMHYWQHFDFVDTTLINNADYTEQAFVDFIYLLTNTPESVAQSSIETLFRNASTVPAMFRHFTALAESYLDDPNSPMLNEDLYISVLETIIALPAIDPASKIRPRHQLLMARKNRPGTIATDFTYTTPTGKKEKLHNLKGDYTLLLFYDPECPDCKRVCYHIANAPVFAEAIAGQTDKNLTVLTICVGDNIDLWRGYLTDVFGVWDIAHGWDMEIREKELYELRAIPCLYLLDRDKRVLLKDAPVEEIEAWLMER